MMTRPNVILIGSQGSGKGTQAQRLADRHGYYVLGTGHILRDHIARGDQLGEEIRETIQRGDLVDDAIIAEIVRETLRTINLDQPIVFDGFPRTQAQAKLLTKIKRGEQRSLSIALYLEILRDVVMHRLAHRFVCADCGKILSDLTTAPDRARCPACGGELTTRTDDEPAIIEKRLNLFYEHTLPLVDYYRGHQRLKIIDATQPIDVVTTAIEAALNF